MHVGSVGNVGAGGEGRKFCVRMGNARYCTEEWKVLQSWLKHSVNWHAWIGDVGYKLPKRLKVHFTKKRPLPLG